MKHFKIREFDQVSTTEEEARQNVIAGAEFVGFNLVEIISFENNIIEFVVESTKEEVSTYYEKFDPNNNLETYYQEV